MQSIYSILEYVEDNPAICLMMIIIVSVLVAVVGVWLRIMISEHSR